MNGGNDYQGRVEVCHNNIWGTVCDDRWNDQDGRVACRQLGLEYVSATTYATFGRGGGVIWLDDLLCNGSEARLVDCRHSGFGTRGCSHYDDAGLLCEGKLVCCYSIYSFALR